MQSSEVGRKDDSFFCFWRVFLIFIVFVCLFTSFNCYCCLLSLSDVVVELGFDKFNMIKMVIEKESLFT